MSQNSVVCGFSALEVARVRVLGVDQKKKSGLWGQDCIKLKKLFSFSIFLGKKGKFNSFSLKNCKYYNLFSKYLQIF